MKSLVLLLFATALAAQVTPAPGWCSMAHCNNQMTDFVPLTPIGLTSGVAIMNRDEARAGVKFGLACVTNGTNFACSYNESPNALVYYDANGNILWTSGGLLDANTYIGASIIQADGSVVIGDDQHIFKFNSNGSVAWSTATPGGQPTSLVTTPNGAIVAATAQVSTNPCFENNCILAATVNTPGSNYTTASVSLEGGDCPGATATATIAGGQITAINVTSQGKACIVPPDVIIQGDGSGADAVVQLYSPTPVAVYNGTTGALVGSIFLYESGNSGPYYLTTNTPCVNNGSHPNRIYISGSLFTNNINSVNQAALWAIDMDPANTTAPATPAWNIIFDGPQGASPLCAGDHIYFDGAGFMPGDNAGTTIFGAQDSGTSASLLFHVSLGSGTGAVTTNFALDPRSTGGFWHQIQGDPNIYHRDATTGALIEQIDTSSPLLALGAPAGTYWDAGVFTTYGSASHPYFILSEHVPYVAAYLAMYDVTDGALIWALPIFPGNSPFPSDTAESMAAMAVNPQGQSVLAITSRYNGAYFITNGPATLSLSTARLDFGNQTVNITSAAETILITNVASTPVTITGITASGDFTQLNNCSAPLGPGVSCSIAAAFAPKATGPLTGTITITSNATGNPQTVSLSGAGISGQPAASLAPTTLSFSPQPAGTTSRPQTVTLTNTGTATLTISGIAASGAAAQSNTCPTSLAPGANCAIYVMFAPHATGAQSGKITITSNAPPQTIAVSGNGLSDPAHSIGLSPTRLVYTAQMVGSLSAPQIVTVTNPGADPVKLTSISFTGDAAGGSACEGVLAPGTHCTISVTFSPVAIGPGSGTVVVTDNTAGSPQTIVVSGTGIGHPVPLLNQPVSPASQTPGAPGFTLMVQGGPFLTGATVNWNGAPLATTLTSTTGLSATVPASDVAAEGTAAITVSNPAPGGGLSNTGWFPVTTPSASLDFNLLNTPAAAGPQAIAAADLNADGRLDLVVANSGANSVSIYLGNGDGTFSAPVNYPTGNQPVAVAVGDFNADGKLDLAVANQTDNTVSILIGNGNGAFAGAKTYPTGTSPVALALADVNGDGTLDIATANYTANSISILSGVGDGTFNQHVDYSAGQAPSALAAGDFNADGIIDLAVANDFLGGTVTVLLGSSSGFQSPVSYTTGDSVALVTADLNGDGHLDLAALNRMEQSLSILLGNGDGTFQPALAAPLTCPPNLGISGQNNGCELDPVPASLAVADLNGDGSLEFAVANTNAGTVSILPGDGNGVFRKSNDYATAAGPLALVAGDFNGDGSLDLAVAALSSNTISVLLQAPDALASVSSINFGNVTISATASQTVTLTNGGSAPLHITAVTASTGFSQTNTCPASIAAGAGCTITVTFAPTTVGPVTGSLTITDNAPGSPQTIALTGTGVAVIVSLTLSKASVIGGNSVTSNTVSLSSAAPPGGASVSLSSSNPSVASVPATVTIPAGSTISPAFSITTYGVAVATQVTITAAYKGSTSTATLTVGPAGLFTLNLSPATVTSGLTTTSNTVILNGGAPPAGAVIELSSANAAVASVPTSVTIPANAKTSPAFTITAGFVTSPTPVVITAGYSGSTVTATLTVNPVTVASVNLSPSAVIGGKPPSQSSNTVTLNAPAPPGGGTVALSSSNSALASVPATVVVPAGGSISPSFTITTTPVAAPTSATISATYNGVTQSAVLTINPAAPKSVMLSATTVAGGNSLPSNRVILNGPAPAAGDVISLSSSNPAIAAVPSTVTVPAGVSTSHPFTITTRSVSSSTTVTISASYLGITASATLTVTP